MTKPVYRRGMTLIEVLLVVSIIGVLAAFVVPPINLAIRSRENAQCVVKLRAAVEAFELYGTETGHYPPDRDPGSVPPEMENYYFPYFKIDWWGDTTEVGGNWDWDAGYHGFDFSVSICNPSRSQVQMEELDQLVDDGNLNTGRFRKVGSQYHFIIED